MILKAILVLHRYLGVAVGLIMLAWCLSGFVMMYQSFPDTSGKEREAGLAAIRLDDLVLDAVDMKPDAPVGGMRIEMLNDHPVMRLGGRQGQQVFDLSTGAKLGEMDEGQVRQVAEAFAASNGSTGQVKSLKVIGADQWTAAVARRNAPLWKAEFSGPGSQGRWVYINGKTGEVVQDATLGERWLSWFGAVPHWLYPTILRENGPVWTQVVIWSSLIGTFLSVTGIVIGVVKLRGRSGRWFPYRRPMWFLHHVFGFFGGVLVLTWTFSGLLTMQPFGWFTSPSAIERGDVVTRLTWADAKPLLAQAQAVSREREIVQVRAAPLLGEGFIVAKGRDGVETRYSAAGPAPVTQAGLQARLTEAGGLLASGRLEVLTKEDSYYYGHHNKVDLPVYRLTLTDKDSTHVYFSHETGEVRRVADATTKRYRWLESGFHSMDFPGLRIRPIWDVVVILLLLAVTAACATGAWLSITRVGRDVSGLFRKR